ncbi:hypothetical protein QBC35DRAFT_457102 [Podospora australis]|uniref:Cyanovirin-N domain-containing protein n=1 Tax=Podospora australis TaxID=1536484 RepID=A0AAN6WIX5_9PEZI|nr:hypothetical protein QBC35DRAFT_457102 [Podospora australis]
MKLIPLLTTLLIHLGLASAYQVRIGHKIHSSGWFGVSTCKPFFKVWDDNWSYTTEKFFDIEPKNCYNNWGRFCGVWGCPFQVDGITIGIRVVEDGGADKAIRVEAWQGAKSTWTWCKNVALTENGGNTVFQWQCDFKGL